MRRLAAALGLVALLVALVVVAVLWSRSARMLADGGPTAVPSLPPAGPADSSAGAPDAGSPAAGTPARRLREMRRATDQHARELEQALEETP